MTTLAEYTPEFARLLGDPEKAVNVRHMFLRKEGLISSAGKGRSAKLTATDGANTVIAALANCPAIEVAETTKRLRKATLHAVYTVDEQGERAVGHLPELTSYRCLDYGHTFGDALDAVLNDLITQGFVGAADDDVVAAIDLSIRKRALGWECKIDFHGQDGPHWWVVYRIGDAAFDGIDVEDPRQSDEAHRRARELVDRHGYKATAVSVNGLFFDKLANLLRGSQIEDLDHG